MQRFGIGVMERASRCRVVGEDRQAGRTWRSAGEGAGRMSREERRKKDLDLG